MNKLNDKSIINWISFNAEHVDGMIKICKKDESFIPGALKASHQFIKDLKKMLNL
jgi:hypothetical protein